MAMVVAVLALAQIPALLFCLLPLVEILVTIPPHATAVNLQNLPAATDVLNIGCKSILSRSTRLASTWSCIYDMSALLTDSGSVALYLVVIFPTSSLNLSFDHVIGIVILSFSSVQPID